MNRIGDIIKNRMHMIQRTGPAEIHHMGPIVPPTIIKPGAHPKFDQENKKAEDKKPEEKKAEGNKEMKKAEEKK